MAPMCRYFAAGACKNGASCPFSHDNAHADSFACPYFAKGYCQYGDKCVPSEHALLCFCDSIAWQPLHGVQRRASHRYRATTTSQQVTSRLQNPQPTGACACRCMYDHKKSQAKPARHTSPGKGGLRIALPVKPPPSQPRVSTSAQPASQPSASSSRAPVSQHATASSATAGPGPCVYFQRGHCQFGNSCRFRHEAPASEQVQAPPQSRPHLHPRPQPQPQPQLRLAQAYFQAHPQRVQALPAMMHSLRLQPGPRVAPNAQRFVPLRPPQPQMPISPPQPQLLPQPKAPAGPAVSAWGSLHANAPSFLPGPQSVRDEPPRPGQQAGLDEPPRPAAGLTIFDAHEDLQDPWEMAANGHKATSALAPQVKAAQEPTAASTDTEPVVQTSSGLRISPAKPSRSNTELQEQEQEQATTSQAEEVAVVESSAEDQESARQRGLRRSEMVRSPRQALCAHSRVLKLLCCIFLHCVFASMACCLGLAHHGGWTMTRLA
jgi:CCCH-type zinc finger